MALDETASRKIDDVAPASVKAAQTDQYGEDYISPERSAGFLLSFFASLALLYAIYEFDFLYSIIALAMELNDLYGKSKGAFLMLAVSIILTFASCPIMARGGRSLMSGCILCILSSLAIEFSCTMGGLSVCDTKQIIRTIDFMIICFFISIAMAPMATSDYGDMSVKSRRNFTYASIFLLSVKSGQISVGDSFKILDTHITIKSMEIFGAAISIILFLNFIWHRFIDVRNHSAIVRHKKDGPGAFSSFFAFLANGLIGTLIPVTLMSMLFTSYRPTFSAGYEYFYSNIVDAFTTQLARAAPPPPRIVDFFQGYARLEVADSFFSGDIDPCRKNTFPYFGGDGFK
ncbi:MAG: hypothetical protein K2Q10_04550 [Rhodospirillales bacterium]|nr:hypothetical protein [Rhodospirillales bacterium]